MLIIIAFLAGSFGLSLVCKKEQRNLFLILMWALLIFITTFRSMTFYTDTKAYYQFYKMGMNKDLGLLFNNVLIQEGKDPFYHFLAACFAQAGIPFRGWMFFISLIYYSGFIYVLKRFSDLPIIAIWGLTCLSYVFFSMTGIRQTMALGLTFFAFIKAYDRKLIPFLIFVFLASLFHSSAWIFLLAYFLIHQKIGFLQIGLVIVAMVVALLFPGVVTRLIEELAWNESLAAYADNAGLSMFGYIVQFALALGTILIAHKYCLEDKQGIALLNMVVLGLVFQSFVIRVDSMFRLSMYFSVYGVVLVGNAIKRQTETTSYMIAYAIVSAAFLAYMLYAGSYTYFSMFGGI